jgi:hypothetical protein
LSVDDRILAIAACEAGGKNALVILGTRTLFVFGPDRRRLASLDLTQLPRASQPSREPLGSLACTKDELAFGTSALKTGHITRLDAQRTGELSVKVLRPVDGLPLGYLSGNRLVLGAIDLGRGRFASALRIEGAGKVQERDVGAPLLDVALEPAAPLGFRAIGVMLDHQLVRLGDELDSIQPVIASGVGVKIVVDEKAACFVTTSKDASEEHDRVALVAFDRGAARRIDTADVDGAVYATTVASLGGEGRAVLIAAYHAPIGKTDVLSLKLSR